MVLSYGPSEHFALFNIFRDLVDEPIAVPDAFCCNQCTLCVETIEDVFEPHSLFPDQVFDGCFEVVKEQLVGFVIHHFADWFDLQPVANRLFEVNDENRHA